MKTYLVTGGAGFVGRALIHRLAWDKENRIVAIVRDNDDVPNCCETVRGSITDPETVRRALSRYEFEGVYHLAAHAKVEECARDPLGMWESNVRGTYTLLEEVRQSHPRLPVVVATSDHAYGNHVVGDPPSKEGDPFVGGGGFYDTSKSCADMVAMCYARQGVDVRVVRCGNIYGPGDRDLSRAVPSFVNDVIHRTPIQIRSNGKAVREYLYIDDAVDGYWRVMNHSNARGGEAYNFAGDDALSVSRLAETVRQAGIMEGYATGDPVVLYQRTGDIRQIRLDTTKAREQLGWKPSTDLKTGLRETILWATGK